MSVHEYARRTAIQMRPRVIIDGLEWTDALDVKARGWLIDCFPEAAEEIAEAPRPTIAAAVHLHYDGGMAAFLDATTAAA